MEKEKAVSELGRVLYERMEHLDPSIVERSWEMLSDRERQFYRLSIAGVFAEDALCRVVLGSDRPANNDRIEQGHDWENGASFMPLRAYLVCKWCGERR
jgi:hypothetical protein